jgi:putative molybdopterin biosynthesis protein
MMDTREVAAYLRLKPRRVYDLVRQQAIPHVRATGKLLFPRVEIERWLAASTSAPRRAGGETTAATRAHPPIIAGSHDPLLEWAARESQCGLAILACGSRAGIARLARGDATAAAMHWLDAKTGEYNVPLVRELLSGTDTVVIEWARRNQGLLVARGNPRKIRRLGDLAKRGVRVVARQPDAGSHRLFAHLLDAAGIDAKALTWTDRPKLAETDLAATISEGRADAGLGIEAAARAHGLDFIPLAVERLDLCARRRDVLDPPLQALLGFARSAVFSAQAQHLGGYDVAHAGRVVFNG